MHEAQEEVRKVKTNEKEINVSNCILIGPYADVSEPNAKCRIALGDNVIAEKDYEMVIGSKEACIRFQLTHHQWIRVYNALQDVFENAPVTESRLVRND